MFLRDHPDDGRAVWLSPQEVDQLLNAAEDTNQRLAIALAAKCGLRTAEVVNVRPSDLVDTDAGPMLRVVGKGDKFRQTPVPPELVGQIQAAEDWRDDPDAPLINSPRGDGNDGTTTRTVRRWLESTRDQLAEEEDPQWSHLSMHDLRRTWTSLVGKHDVDPPVIMEWGGWSSLDTFLQHYKDAYSPAAQARERDKVDWL
jgi:integrase